MEPRLQWKVVNEEHRERDQVHRSVEKQVECGRFPNGTLEKKTVMHKDIMGYFVVLLGFWV